MGNSSHTVPATYAGGRYHIKRLLGEGGSKRVYLAHDSRLERDVAFALIKTEGLDADGQTRVRREARAMGQLGEHPNIVNIYNIGDDAGRLFIVSQYLAHAKSASSVGSCHRTTSVSCGAGNARKT